MARRRYSEKKKYFRRASAFIRRNAALVARGVTYLVDGVKRRGMTLA